MKKTACLTLFSLLFLSACGSGSGDGAGSNPDPGDSGGGSGSTRIIGNCSLSPDEQTLIEAHNAARAEARFCGEVSMPPAPPLDWNCTLGMIALAHSEDMGNQDFFDHTGSDGLSPFDRMDNAGYPYRYAGENIAAGQPDVTTVMSGWIASPGHCKNLMSADFTEMGGGIYSTATGSFSIYWTVDFGTPR